MRQKFSSSKVLATVLRCHELGPATSCANQRGPLASPLQEGFKLASNAPRKSLARGTDLGPWEHALSEKSTQRASPTLHSGPSVATRGGSDPIASSHVAVAFGGFARLTMPPLGQLGGAGHLGQRRVLVTAVLGNVRCGFLRASCPWRRQRCTTG